jgi:hypothetical protein
VIYVIAEEGQEDGPVKIGVTGIGPVESSGVKLRVDSLQTGNWRCMIVVALLPGDATDEHALHVRFESSHVRGEWFARTPELNAFIEENRCEPVRSTAGLRKPSERGGAPNRGARPPKPPPPEYLHLQLGEDRARAPGLCWTQLRPQFTADETDWTDEDIALPRCPKCDDAFRGEMRHRRTRILPRKSDTLPAILGGRPAEPETKEIA